MTQLDSSRPGKLITLEGGEGAGKSTSLNCIQECLSAHGLEVVLSREPGGTDIGEQIREILLSPKNVNKVSTETELLLMFAARAEHLSTVIYPALERGAWVVSDRFTDASYAYQGGGRQLAASRIKVLEDWLQGGFQADLSLFLDLPVEQGLARAAQRSEKDRFEREQLGFFERVRTAYLQRAADDPLRFRVVDASQDLALVQSQIIGFLDQFVNDNLN